MITAKTLYKVPKCNGKSSLSYFSVGIWCTENIECENMTLEEAIINSKCISGHIIDESIKNLLIFMYLMILMNLDRGVRED